MTALVRAARPARGCRDLGLSGRGGGERAVFSAGSPQCAGGRDACEGPGKSLGDSRVRVNVAPNQPLPAGSVVSSNELFYFVLSDF